MPKREQKQVSCDQVSSASQEERLGDKIAAIVDAFYYLNANDRMGALKDKLRALPVSESAPRRSIDGGG